MRISYYGETLKYDLIRAGRTNTEIKHFEKKLSVDNRIIMLVGGSGSGKSTAVFTIANELHKRKKYKVVFVTEKVGNEFESSFMEIPIIEQYHKAIIEKMLKIKPYTITNIKGSIHRLHPFTFNIPTHKIPETSFFTFSLKNQIFREGFSALLQMSTKTRPVKACNLVKRNMPNNTNIIEFLHLLTDKIKKNRKDEAYSLNEDEFFVPGKLSTNVITIDAVRDRMSVLKQHWFIRQDDDPLNLDYVKELNDQERISVLTTKYIPDIKDKIFVILTFLQNLKKAISSEKIKYPVLLVFEEIKILLPKKTEEEDVVIFSLVQFLRGLLAGIRNQGRGVFVISTTQDYSLTNKDFRAGCSPIFLFKLSAEDLRFFINQRIISDSAIDIIKELKTGEMIGLDSIDDNPGTKFYVHMPPFALPEEKYNFVDLYKKFYPDRMINYKNFLVEQRKIQKNIFMEQKMIVKKKIEAHREKKKVYQQQRLKEKIDKSYADKNNFGKQNQKNFLTKTERYRKEVEERKKKKEKDAGTAINLRKQGKSWTDISHELGYSFQTIKKHAYAKAKKNLDLEFFNIEKINIS